MAEAELIEREIILRKIAAREAREPLLSPHPVALGLPSEYARRSYKPRIETRYETVQATQRRPDGFSRYRLSVACNAFANP